MNCSLTPGRCNKHPDLLREKLSQSPHSHSSPRTGWDCGLRGGGNNEAPGHLQRRRGRGRPHPQQPPAGDIGRIARATQIIIVEGGGHADAQPVGVGRRTYWRQWKDAPTTRHAPRRRPAPALHTPPAHTASWREFSTQSPASIGRDLISREGVCPCCQPGTGSAKAG